MAAPRATRRAAAIGFECPAQEVVASSWVRYGWRWFRSVRTRPPFRIRGNHDKIGARLPWDDVFDVARVVVPGADGSAQGPWLSHYAHLVWPRMHRGDLHLYGHSHGTLASTAASFDVGVDCWVAPVQLEAIVEQMALTPAARKAE